MAERVRVAIVLGVGGAAVGGPEALRLLLTVAGRSAVADLAICVFLVSTFTSLVLGNLLLARFFRDEAAAAPAPATERLARVTAAVALAAMFLVIATLLAVPSIMTGRGNAAGGAARSCST